MSDDLYLFDGYNVLRAAGLEERRTLVDLLASFLALRGATRVLVFDGTGDDQTVGPLEVRFAEHADDVIERLAAEHRETREVWVVTSDAAVLGTAGQRARRLRSEVFVRELATDEKAPRSTPSRRRSRVEDALDAETRNRLESIRRQKD